MVKALEHRSDSRFSIASVALFLIANLNLVEDYLPSIW
jgi:hypothetical protein